MDRHLQFMLKQTEDYTKRLSKNIQDGSFAKDFLLDMSEFE